MVSVCSPQERLWAACYLTNSSVESFRAKKYKEAVVNEDIWKDENEEGNSCCLHRCFVFLTGKVFGA
ncbi:hypothetical protein EJ110_NYTH54314 [Nymphaea thermarum]|nr:hypothetical protein EJ110_NYTH54314 [Nymphaea thermarum]